jgi:hypothetical protein
VEGEESTSSPGADIMNMLMGCEGAGSGEWRAVCCTVSCGGGGGGGRGGGRRVTGARLQGAARWLQKALGDRGAYAVKKCNM